MEVVKKLSAMERLRYKLNIGFPLTLIILSANELNFNRNFLFANN